MIAEISETFTFNTFQCFMILRAEFADVVVESKRGRLEEEILENYIDYSPLTAVTLYVE